jgi:hypothetical protein
LDYASEFSVDLGICFNRLIGGQASINLIPGSREEIKRATNGPVFAILTINHRAWQIQFLRPMFRCMFGRDQLLFGKEFPHQVRGRQIFLGFYLPD